MHTRVNTQSQALVCEHDISTRTQTHAIAWTSVYFVREHNLLCLSPPPPTHSLSPLSLSLSLSLALSLSRSLALSLSRSLALSLFRSLALSLSLALALSRSRSLSLSLSLSHFISNPHPSPYAGNERFQGFSGSKGRHVPVFPLTLTILTHNN